MSTICPVCLRKPTSDLHVDEGQDDLGPEWLSSGVAWEWPDPAAGQVNARGRWPLGRQCIVPLQGGLVRLGTHTQTLKQLHQLNIVTFLGGLKAFGLSIAWIRSGVTSPSGR